MAAQHCDRAAAGPLSLLDLSEVLELPVDAGPMVAGPANLKEIRCLAKRKFRKRGKDLRELVCRGMLLEVPRQERYELIALVSRDGASGQCAVKKCECGQWWELRRAE